MSKINFFPNTPTTTIGSALSTPEKIAYGESFGQILEQAKTTTQQNPNNLTINTNSSLSPALLAAFKQDAKGLETYMTYKSLQNMLANDENPFNENDDNGGGLFPNSPVGSFTSPFSQPNGLLKITLSQILDNLEKQGTNPQATNKIQELRKLIDKGWPFDNSIDKSLRELVSSLQQPMENDDEANGAVERANSILNNEILPQANHPGYRSGINRL